ncbi:MULTISPECIES: hypothetical protein [Paraburkholderia]|jgi:hypothetical protein|uniref:hypothetical protein n=1 Tax=Paraburkholderia TaxID=1822464 RepID=UPI0038BA75DC
MWLQSVERIHGRLHGRLVSEKGVVEWMDMQSIWQHQLPLARRTKASAVTRLHEWEVTDASEYLQLAGLDADLAGGHTVYGFSYNGLRFLVPAILVSKGLFQPNATLFEYLYRPSALELLLAPVPEAETVTVRLLPRYARTHRVPSDSALANLGWLYCFPSARDAWNSVYSSAARGLVHVTMPKVQAHLHLRGVLSDSTLAVSSLSIRLFQPMERPFEWAGIQPDQFCHRPKAGSVAPKARLIKADIEKGPNGWALSEWEWHSIKHLFSPHLRQRTDEQIRTLVSAILVKLGSGSGWMAVNASHGTTAKVSSFYRNNCVSGRWNEVERIIRKLRKSPGPDEKAAASLHPSKPEDNDIKRPSE